MLIVGRARTVRWSWLRDVVWGVVSVWVTIWTRSRTWVHRSALIVVITWMRSCRIPKSVMYSSRSLVCLGNNH